jgi:hypothetical protein
VPGGDAILTTEEESGKAAGRFRTALPQVSFENMSNGTCVNYNFIMMHTKKYFCNYTAVLCFHVDFMLKTFLTY